MCSLHETILYFLSYFFACESVWIYVHDDINQIHTLKIIP